MFRTTLQANVLCCGQSLGSKKVLEAVKERPQIMKRERWVKTTSELPEHWEGRGDPQRWSGLSFQSSTCL